jgi:hypothetical protein
VKRFLTLLAVVAFLTAALALPQAAAINLGGYGPRVGSIWDYSALYRGGVPNLFDTTAEYAPGNLPIQPGDELRAIFRVDWIDEDPSTAPYLFTDGVEQLTGMVYDLLVTAVIPGPTTISVFLGAGPRYAETIPGDGGRVDLWLDSAPDWGTSPALAPQAGPWAWIPGGDGVVNPAPPIPHDDYPGASNTYGAGVIDPGAGGMNALQWLALEFVPMPLSAIPGTLFQIDLPYVVGPGGGALLTGSGTGWGFLHVIGGSYGLIQTGTFGSAPNGASIDVTVRETLTFCPDVKFPAPFPNPDLYGWTTQSHDPLRFTHLPEPATMSLLVMGLLGGAGAYWRRRLA